MKIPTATLLRLQTQHQCISFFLSNKDSILILKRHDPLKWSIHENLAHLGRYQEIFEGRVHKMLKETTPYFGRYSAEDDNVFQLWVKKDTKKVLSDLISKRLELIDLFENLSEQEFLKRGSHPKLGEMNMITWIEFFLLHEAHHIYQIFWMLNSTLKQDE